MHNPLTEILAILDTTPARWTVLCRGLTPEIMRRQPLPGEWSALECLFHILDTEKYVFPVRVEAFLLGLNFPAFNPDVQGTKDSGQTPVELAGEFAALRDRVMPKLRGLTSTDLARTAMHAELGSVTLGQLLHEWAGHDLMHTVQAERALMQPFIAGCGPWRKYFADHDVVMTR
jgi:hypothetical protein